MTSRYQNNSTKKNKEGKVVYQSRIYSKIPLSDNDVYVATETGDRLDSLAYEYYGDSTLWWIIAAANKLHNGKFALADGTVLRIPANYINIINNFIN
jgi:nucleoid-associated protein YgaU